MTTPAASLLELVDSALVGCSDTELAARARELPGALLAQLVRGAPDGLRLSIASALLAAPRRAKPKRRRRKPGTVSFEGERFQVEASGVRRRTKDSGPAVERRRRAKGASPGRAETPGPMMPTDGERAAPVSTPPPGGVRSAGGAAGVTHQGDATRLADPGAESAVSSPRAQRCGICREVGHKRRTCPKRDPLQQVADSERGSGPPAYPPKEAEDPPPSPRSSAQPAWDDPLATPLGPDLPEPTAAPSNGAAKPLPWAMRPPPAPPITASASKPKVRRRCGVCGDYGHRRETCPKANAEPARSSREHAPRAAADSMLPTGARVLGADEIRQRLLEGRLGGVGAR
jgi:hypothetical protein